MTSQTPQDPHSSDSTTHLTGDEGGVWRVSTQTSFYVFDLDAMSVTRHPGEHAATTINDTSRPIDTIFKCTVGESGYWTMKSEPDFAFGLQDYWQVTTAIQRIERLAPLNR